jgi:hypothetical protein
MKKLLLALALIFLATPAFAALTANSVVTAQTPKLAVVQFLQGTDSAGTYKTLYTGGTNGTKVSGMWVTSNDASAAHLLTCQLVRSAVFYGGMAITVAVNSGYANGAPAISLMSSTNWPGLPIDGNGNPYLYLSSGDTIQCTFATAITSTDMVNVAATVSDF